MTTQTIYRQYYHINMAKDCLHSIEECNNLYIAIYTQKAHRQLCRWALICLVLIYKTMITLLLQRQLQQPQLFYGCVFPYQLLGKR
jgi:hypothetical protein